MKAQQFNTLDLNLIHVGFADLDHKWNFKGVLSPFSRLYYIEKGEGYVSHNGNKIKMTAGNLYLIPSFSKSDYFCPDSMQQYYLSFFDSFTTDLGVYDSYDFTYEIKASPIDLILIKRLLELHPFKVIHQSDPKTYDNTKALQQLPFMGGQTDAQMLETKGILFQLFSKFMRQPKENNSEQSKSFRVLSKAVQFIHNNIAIPLTVSDLASIVHLHPDYFSRIFLEVIGQRPSEYIQEQKMQIARSLLASTSISIQEVAYQVGITNQAYFSRQFKKHFEISPKQVRK